MLSEVVLVAVKLRVSEVLLIVALTPEEPLTVRLLEVVLVLVVLSVTLEVTLVWLLIALVALVITIVSEEFKVLEFVEF